MPCLICDIRSRSLNGVAIGFMTLQDETVPSIAGSLTMSCEAGASSEGGAGDWRWLGGEGFWNFNEDTELSDQVVIDGFCEELLDGG